LRGGPISKILNYDKVKNQERVMSLGELQQLTMLAVARLEKGAYGAAIQTELESVARRKVSVPTIYVTLVRLEEEGLVESSEEAAREETRSGRARRLFRLTPAGWAALQESRAVMTRMWKGVATR
jgi:PadR family transcriptional regulator PadR